MGVHRLRRPGRIDGWRGV